LQNPEPVSAHVWKGSVLPARQQQFREPGLSESAWS